MKTIFKSVYQKNVFPSFLLSSILSLIYFFTISIVFTSPIKAEENQINSNTDNLNQPQTQTSPSHHLDGLTTKAIDLAKKKNWEAQSFDEAIFIVKDKNEPTKSRELLLHKAFSEKRRLTITEKKRLLSELTQIAKASDEPASLRALAIRDMASHTLFMQETGEISRKEALAEKQFLLDIIQDGKRDFPNRASAIKAVDILKIKDAVPHLKNILADSKNANQPEIIKGSCLALMRLAGKDSIKDINNVLSSTEDPSVFSTAAYCLGQTKSIASMTALMNQKNKFPDTGAMGFSLVEMENEILSVLKQQDSPNLVPAIRATEYLWRNGQRERYTPLLFDLLSSQAPIDARKGALERIINDAKRLSFEEEKKELRNVLAFIKDDSELSEFIAGIQERLGAKVLKQENSDIKISTEK